MPDRFFTPQEKSLLISQVEEIMQRVAQSILHKAIFKESFKDSADEEQFVRTQTYPLARVLMHWWLNSMFQFYLRFLRYSLHKSRTLLLGRWLLPDVAGVFLSHPARLELILLKGGNRNETEA